MIKNKSITNPPHKLIVIITLFSICLVYTLLYLSVFIKTPFVMDGDVFFHMGNVQLTLAKNDLDPTLYYNEMKPNLYFFVPLFNILNSLLLYTTHLDVVYIMLFLNLLFLNFFIIIVYLLTKVVTRSSLAALFSAFFIIPVGNSHSFGVGYTPFHFLHLTPLIVATFLFLTFLYLLFNYLSGTFQGKKFYVLFFITLLSMFFYHHEGPLRFVIILVLSFLFMIFAIPEFKAKLFKVTLLLLGSYFLFLATNLAIFSSHFGLSKRLLDLAYTGGDTFTDFTLGLQDFYGELLTVLILLSFVYFLKNYKNLKMRYTFFSLTLSLPLLLYKIPFYLFNYRFLYLTIYPVIILSTISLLVCLRNRFKILKYLLLILILFVVIIPFQARISKTNLGTTWDYIKDVQWVRDNLHDKKVVSDFWVLFKLGGMGRVDSSYSFDRPGLAKDDIIKLREVEDIQEIFNNPSYEAHTYALSKNIQYIILDNDSTLYRTGSDISTFENPLYFKRIYSNNLIVFEVI